MHTFVEHYFLQEKLISDIRRSLTSNLIKKRKVGVDLGRGKYKKVIEAESSIFNEVLDTLQKGARDFFVGRKEKKTLLGIKKGGLGLSSTLKKLSGTEIKGVYEGEIDSGEDNIKGNPISSLVFELKNRGRIAFITTEDDDKIRFYIATGTRGNDFLRENLGTTLEQIHSESLAKMKKEPRKLKEPKEKDLDVSRDVDSEEEPKTSEKPKETEEYGITDVNKDDYDNLELYWGDGKRGGIIKGSVYPFRGKFKRERYYNVQTGYKGYKYFDNVGNVVYLVDNNDGKNAFIAFKDKISYDWAKRIGMLDFWKSGISKRNKIDWKEGNLKDELE